MWASVMCMSIGFACGAAIKYGISYAVVVALTTTFFYMEMKRCAQRSFQWVMSSYVCAYAAKLTLHQVPPASRRCSTSPTGCVTIHSYHFPLFHFSMWAAPHDIALQKKAYQLLEGDGAYTASSRQRNKG
jgi:hypothetical protein